MTSILCYVYLCIIDQISSKAKKMIKKIQHVKKKVFENIVLGNRRNYYVRSFYTIHKVEQELYKIVFN